MHFGNEGLSEFSFWIQPRWIPPGLGIASEAQEEKAAAPFRARLHGGAIASMTHTNTSQDKHLSSQNHRQPP